MPLTSLLRIILTRSLKPFVFKGQHKEKLDFKNLDNLGLYVHIPFCRSICQFCPYCKEKYNKALALRYKDALLREIELVCKGSHEKKTVTSLYFGGGTPALMMDNLSEIIQMLNRFFVIKDGIGVELHPDDINDDILTTLKTIGVTMVSVGVQSFDKGCLNKIGRPYTEFEEKLSLIKRHHFSVVDVDLIFGIPGQTEDTIKNDIETAFKYGATQISTYPFIDFTFADNAYQPLSQKQKRKMLAFLSQVCLKLGLERTAVWTFAQKNTGKYSSVTRDTFLGFGVSATTLLKDSFKINTFSINEYINRVNEKKLPTSLTLDFTIRQRAVYYLFWSAYGLKINENNFMKIVGKPLHELYKYELILAEKMGLLIRKDGKYHLTDKAMYLYHYLEQQYTTAYIDKMWHISRETAFPKKIVLK